MESTLRYVRQHSVTKTPDGELVAYTTDSEVKVLIPATGEARLVYRETKNYSIGSVPSIAANRRYVAFCRNEQTPMLRAQTMPVSKSDSIRSKTDASPWPT